MRTSLLALVGVGALVLASPPVGGAPSPIRSGSVLGGVIDTGPGSTCGTNPDCRAWVLAGCPSELAGQDVAVMSAIVPVADLAGRRTLRRLEVLPGASAQVPVGDVIGGFRVQFWSAECREVVPRQPVRDANRTYYPEYVRTKSWFRIPPRVAWMTLAADDNALVRWELY